MRSKTVIVGDHKFLNVPEVTSRPYYEWDIKPPSRKKKTMKGKHKGGKSKKMPC